MVAAWAQLSRVASTAYVNTTPTAELARTAETAAERALRLVPDAPEGLLARGTYDRIVNRDLPAALDVFQRARRLAPSDAQIASELAVLFGDLGRFDDALREFNGASQLDPRAARPWVYRGRLLLRMHRVEEARAAAERALALAPTALSAISVRTLVELAAGDLAAARRVVATAERDVARERVVAYVGNYWDLGWILDADDERLLYSLPPTSFADAGAAALVRAEQHHWRGDAGAARPLGVAANRALELQEREAPNDPQRANSRGLALAYAGQPSEALSSMRKSLAMTSGRPGGLTSISYAYFLYVGARAALIAGDRDQALAWLRESFERRYFITPAWVRLDPSWTPLHGDPRFEKLLAEAK
jgi:tetratricopeptide (TPR) repeat protein